MPESTLAPGTRILVRDAEWIVKRVDRTSSGRQAITATGLSEIVKDKQAVFLDEIETDIRVVNPEQTAFVADESPYYRDSRLYIESLLRQTPPTDERLYCGHRGAMDLVHYQLDPAIQALRHTSQRILMADAVGLGKTIEVGILLSELIKRGRGKRILVLAVKSMLTQFQKELWSRFTIPLVRLDSIGIQRIRSHIPTNHNPFYYYDKSIISIDTLKQDAEYRTFLENCYWDVIVIDEAHNVAERGTRSMRSRLAKLLSRRSDALIMASATPHDGRARSFASLMNMLDPTAITDPDDYGPEDIKGLFIRRFKKDIQGQVAGSFKERSILRERCHASPAEETVFDTFTRLSFTRIDKKRGSGKLFKTTLEKALFSSPAACIQTIDHRIRNLQQREDPEYDPDIRALCDLRQQVEMIKPRDYAKYQKLLHIINDPDHRMHWTPDDPEDRLVIFTERIETLRFLQKQLPKDLNLKTSQVQTLYGEMSDIDQQQIVEAFGRNETPVRLLIASDVASEGINLHYLSHRMIHFDIPWSLMVFQQRNGRIDRYGQRQNPLILYLVTESDNEKIKGDTRILELLIEKDQAAVKNIGDPSAIMGDYDVELEEQRTARAMEDNLSREQFDQQLSQKPFDPLEFLLQKGQEDDGAEYDKLMTAHPSLYASDYEYACAAFDYVRAHQNLQVEFDNGRRIINMTVPDELRQHRFKFLPSEIQSPDNVLSLCADRNAVMREIERSRKQEEAWPRLHLLWEQHPVLEWLNDKILAAFGRNQAPVITVNSSTDDTYYLVTGLVPNRKGQPVLHEWFAVRFQGESFADCLPFRDIIDRLQTRLPNRLTEFDESALSAKLPQVVKQARLWMTQSWKHYEAELDPTLQQRLRALQRLQQNRHRFLREQFDFDRMTPLQQSRYEREKRQIDKLFQEHQQWVQDTLSIENQPYIRIVAVIQETQQ